MIKVNGIVKATVEEGEWSNGRKVGEKRKETNKGKARI